MCQYLEAGSNLDMYAASAVLISKHKHSITAAADENLYRRASCFVGAARRSGSKYICVDGFLTSSVCVRKLKNRERALGERFFTGVGFLLSAEHGV